MLIVGYVNRNQDTELRTIDKARLIKPINWYMNRQRVNRVKRGKQSRGDIKGY